MSIVKATSHSSGSSGRTLNYAMNEDKTVDLETGEQYVEGFGGCNPNYATEEFALNKQHWDKEGGRQCLHFVNSFPGQEVTPEQALNATRELVERTPNFEGFQGVIACHCHDENIHVHIVADSVNVENGKKFQMGPDSYKQFKELNQQICREHGYSVVPMQKNEQNISADKINKYKAMERGNSHIQQCYESVLDASQKATNKEEFIKQMNYKGWEVNWTDKKYITFVDMHERQANGKPLKFRDKNISKTFQEDIGKESLSHAFEKNRTRQQTIERADQQLGQQADQPSRKLDTGTIKQQIRDRGIEQVNIELERRKQEAAKLKQEREELTTKQQTIKRSAHRGR